MASGPDPDAPDWFEPEIDDEDLDVDAAPPPGAGERSKESTVVHIDDLSPDDVRGGATTADSDSEVDIIEASRETDDDEPSFNGDIPGFSDWREELRERLKRIRARREQERQTDEEDEPEEETAEEIVAAAEADDVAAAETEEVATVGETEDLEVADQADEAEAIDEEQEAEGVDEEEELEVTVAAEEPEEVVLDDDLEEIEAVDDEEELAAAPATAGDIIARIVDGSDAGPPDALILGERKAAPVAEDDEEGVAFEAAAESEEQDEKVGESASNEEADEEAIEPAVGATEEDDGMVFDLEEPAGDKEDFIVLDLEEPDIAQVEDIEKPVASNNADDTFSWGEAGADSDAVAGFRMVPKTTDDDLDEIFSAAPTSEEEGEVAEVLDRDKNEEEERAPTKVAPADDDKTPELEFDEVPRPTTPAPEIDLIEDEGEDEDHALEWDEEEELVTARHGSSAAPLGERAAAAVCDTLVLTAIGIALVGAAASGADVPFRQILVEETPWVGLAWAIFAVGYSVFLVGACGQTIGRMVMRVRVVGDDQFSVGFGRAGKRLGFWVISAAPLLAGMLPALRDPQRRALHDRLSHTRVVKA
ncbi:MAG: RDD family protein [Acidobacteriota bacterium]